MPVGVFVDTSAIAAWALASEQHHVEAVRELARIMLEGGPLYVTPDVFDEAVTLVLGRADHGAAVSIGEALRGGPAFRWMDVDAKLRDEAWRLFRRHSDHPLSFTDCTSIVVMRSLGIDEVFSFDSDFDRVGLRRRPR